MQDHYKTLGVSPRDDFEAIRRTYRRLVRELHPDFSADPSANARFLKVAEAYRILADEKARRRYDAERLLRLLVPSQRLRELVDDPQLRHKVAAKIAHGLHRLTSYAAPPKGIAGRNVELTQEISFAESYTGARAPVTYRRRERCPDCHGTGCAATAPCPACEGRGRILVGGPLGIAKRCPRCGGYGLRGEGACTTCRGQGMVERDASVKIKVPAGVAHLGRLRIKDRGDQGRLGGVDGDLVVEIRVAGSLNYSRSGRDLLTDITIGAGTAVLGGTVDIPLPDGRTIEAILPGGLYGGRRIRLAGRGFALPDQERRGDLFLTVEVAPPDLLPDAQRTKVEEWLREAQRTGGHVHPQLNREVRRIFGSDEP